NVKFSPSMVHGYYWVTQECRQYPHRTPLTCTNFARLCVMARTKLQPGENTIKQVKATTFRKGKAIRWRGRDYTGRVHDKRTQGKDVGECRARALRQWEKILAES